MRVQSLRVHKFSHSEVSMLSQPIDEEEQFLAPEDLAFQETLDQVIVPLKGYIGLTGPERKDQLVLQKSICSYKYCIRCTVGM